MNSYEGFTRTNYFSVTNPDRLHEIVASIKWDNDDAPGFMVELDGKFAFGKCSGIKGPLSKAHDCPNDEEAGEEDLDDDHTSAKDVYAALKSIVAAGDAIIITEVGHAGYDLAVAHSIIITCDFVQYLDLRTFTLEEARKALCRSDYNPRMDY